MKRALILTLAAGAVTAVGIGFGMQAAESGQRSGGESYRGSHAGHGGGEGGWGRHGGGHRSGRHRGRRGHGMRRMMERFDADKDGKLTQAEIDGSRTALVAKHDANGDGKLTLAEFQNLWLEVRNRRMVRSFQRLDEDGDAAVTVDEFVEPYARMVERMDRNNDGAIDKQDRRRRGGWHKNRRKFGGGDDKKADGETTEQ